MGEHTEEERNKSYYKDVLLTNTGHKLTAQEAKFIDEYIVHSNGTQAVKKAGYGTNNPRQYAIRLLSKDYIKDEIKFRLEQLHNASIADADEILQYFTSVMRGEVADQFGLEASLSERTRAAQELAKRKIDVPNRLSGQEQPEVRIVLDWKRTDDSKEVD